MPGLNWKHIDKNLLVAIPNPSKEAYEIKMDVPEFTFLGANEQPDFGKIYLTFYPKNTIIELKALKHYFFQFRNVHISYERAINIIYDHLMEIFKPERLRIYIEFYPRGGITSKLTIDSDWKDRGGEEKYWKQDQY